MTSKLTGEGDEGEVPKNIAIFGNKRRLLSIDMKTKVVQHVPRVKRHSHMYRHRHTQSWFLFFGKNI